MAFIETQFPVGVGLGFKGGPVFNTTVVQVSGGGEQRNQVWTYPLHKYDATQGIQTDADKESFMAIFWAAAGRANGFRFKDWNDYSISYTNGTLGPAGVGDGTPGPYQIYKSYVFGSTTAKRKISKPTASGFTVKRAGSLATQGAAAGNYAYSTTAGTVTFVADASSNASAITPGATTSVVLAANPGTLIAGQKLYLSGFTGTDAALVNSLAHTINSVSGAGPYTFILATNTAGKTITVGAGAGKKYPQVSEALTCAGEFDVPVRFSEDSLQITKVGGQAYMWDQIMLEELRI